MKKKWLLFLPLFSILAMSILLLLGLQQDPKKLAQALIGKTVPEFHQQNLLKTEQVLSNLDFPKQFFLLNVWGSWCIYCKQEHPFLIRLAKQGIPIVGLNYRDNPQSAVKMLQEMGNPFHFVINDSQGQLATKLAVEGAPETYLVDAQGIIRYHYSGLLNEKVWQQQFMPILKQEKGVQE